MLTLIWAMSENGAIGRDGGLPWTLPADLAHFMRTTLEHPVIMGRRTYESVGNRLPRRTNIVVTRNPDYRADGIEVARDLDAALEIAARSPGSGEVFVCGGAEVYRAALPRAGRLNVTIVHAEIDGDTWFPEMDWSDWRLLADERHDADADHEYAFSFRIYERR